MMNQSKVFTLTTEELFSHLTGQSRGIVKVKENQYTLLALIGRRWCSVKRVDGKLYEVWNN